MVEEIRGKGGGLREWGNIINNSKKKKIMFPGDYILIKRGRVNRHFPKIKIQYVGNHAERK